MMKVRTFNCDRRLLRIALAAVLAIASVGVAGAQEERLEKSRQEITGVAATVSAAEQERLALLTLSNRCSASLLRNNWAITAAHCVDRPDPDRPGEFITNPDDSVTLTANWPTVQQRQSMRIITFRPRDVAIIRVATPFSVGGSDGAFNREIFRGAFKKLKINAYGRGIFQLAQGSGTSAMPSQRDGQYRVAAFTVDREDGGTYSFPTPGGQMIAGGDSGGPSFVSSPAGDVLVGVHSSAEFVCLPGRSCPRGQWDWITATPRSTDESAAAVWDDIDRYLGAFVPPPAPGGIRPAPRIKGPATTLSICESALGARARNSPAAPGLESQCRAFVSGLAAKGEAITNQDPAAVALRNRQPDAAARRGFDIGMAAAEGQTADGPGKQSIHDSLPPAEQAGYAAAVSFSLARNRDSEEKRDEELAARGAEIASRDPLAVELRNQQPEGPTRHGFDIGMAAAEGQTAPGPGKDRIRDSLPAAERAGFVAAVAFSLERNKYADRAALGAVIAAADAAVAVARNANPDPFWRLGFDIATAIFGNPALGAQGNTQAGPGALGIQNSLSPSGQRGFRASARLHLSRKY